MKDVALTLAVEFAKRNPSASAEDVVQIATAFYTWLNPTETAPVKRGPGRPPKSDKPVTDPE